MVMRRLWGGTGHTGKQIAQEHEYVLHDILALGGRFQHALLPGAPDKQRAVAVQVGLDRLLAHIAFDLVDGPDAGELLFGQRARAHRTVPGNRPLADVALQRCQICRRVE